METAAMAFDKRSRPGQTPPSNKCNGKPADERGAGGGAFGWMGSKSKGPFYLL